MVPPPGEGVNGLTIDKLKSELRDSDIFVSSLLTGWNH
jgi:hypothetical protein